MAQLKAGARLKSAVCATEVIVIAAPAVDAMRYIVTESRTMSRSLTSTVNVVVDTPMVITRAFGGDHVNVPVPLLVSTFPEILFAGGSV